MISFLAYLYEVKKDSDAWRTWGKELNSIEFYLYKENLESYSNIELRDILKEVAKETGVNIIKTSYSSKDGTITITKGIEQNSEFLPSVTLKTGENINKFDFSNVEYSTDTNVKDYFNDDRIIIEDLSKSIDKYGAAGEYIVLATKYSSAELFLDKLAKRINVDISILRSKKTFEKTDYSVQFYLTAILFVLFILIYAISNVFYVAKQAKEIAVLKMNGDRLSTIFMNVVKESVQIQLLVYVLINLFIVIFYKNTNFRYYLLFLVFFILILVLQVIFSGVTFIYLGRQNFALLIKGKKNLKFITIVSKVFQMLFLVLASYSLIFTVSILGDLVEQKKKLDNWTNYQDYEFIGSSSIGDDIESIKGNNHKLIHDYSKFYDFLEANGAEYFKIQDLIDSQGNNTGIKVVDVNMNYLKKYKINFEVNFNEDSQYLFIPKSMESNKEKIEDIKREYYKSLNSHLSMIGEKIVPSKIYVKVYEQTISMPNLVTGGNIENMVISVKNNKNISVIEKAELSQSSITSAVKFENISKKKIQEYLDQSGLKDNKLKIVSVEQWFISEKENLLNSLYVAIFFAVIIIISTIFISFQEALISFENRKKDLAIKKLNGYDLVARHGIRLLVNIGIFLLSITISTLTLLRQINLYTMLILVILFLVYAIAECSIIVRDEKSIVNLVVKGE